MKNVKSNYRIAITGNIGSGKSYFAHYLREHGYNVFECDNYVHILLKEHREIIEQIIKKFGKDILSEGVINRGELGKRVFECEELDSWLKSLVHPHVIDKINSLKGMWFVEIPLLFESNTQDMYDEVVLIYTSKYESIKRVCQRNQVSEDYAEKIYNKQLDIEFKRKKSDYVIDNVSSFAEFLVNIEHYMEGLNERRKEN